MFGATDVLIDEYYFRTREPGMSPTGRPKGRIFDMALARSDKVVQ